MTNFKDNNEEFLSDDADDAGMNTMAVLNTLGGGGDAMAEGEPMGLDPDAGKAKVSGSSLAVGVVVVLGAATLLGMKLTLGALGGGAGPSDAMAEIDSFIAKQSAAQQVGHDGPIKAPDAESTQVLEELKQDPTDGQVPAEEVKTNPFDISNLVTRAVVPKTGDDPSADPRELAVNRAKAAAGKLKIDGISGQIVFIDGKDYRVGDTIGDGTFELATIDGLTCIVRTTDEFGIALRLRYR
jgi:hypothetical protein